VMGAPTEQGHGRVARTMSAYWRDGFKVWAAWMVIFSCPLWVLAPREIALLASLTFGPLALLLAVLLAKLTGPLP
jgi:hypothetical protein